MLADVFFHRKLFVTLFAIFTDSSDNDSLSKVESVLMIFSVPLQSNIYGEMVKILGQ